MKIKVLRWSKEYYELATNGWVILEELENNWVIMVAYEQ